MVLKKIMDITLAYFIIDVLEDHPFNNSGVGLECGELHARRSAGADAENIRLDGSLKTLRIHPFPGSHLLHTLPVNIIMVQ